MASCPPSGLQPVAAPAASTPSLWGMHLGDSDLESQEGVRLYRPLAAGIVRQSRSQVAPRHLGGCAPLASSWLSHR